MATQSPFTTLTADGDYQFATKQGHKHMLTLKGTFDGATVVMTAYNNALQDYTSVNGGSWTAETEINFYAPSDLINLSVSSASGSTVIGVNLLPIYDR